MAHKDIDRFVADKSDKDLNWATSEDWVRAVASLEAETGVDILIGADSGNNLSSIEYISSSIENRSQFISGTDDRKSQSPR